MHFPFDWSVSFNPSPFLLLQSWCEKPPWSSSHSPSMKRAALLGIGFGLRALFIQIIIYYLVVLPPWVTLFETAKLAEIKTEVQQAPSPQPKPLNSFPLHNCCQTFEHLPLPTAVPIPSKILKHNFTFELREKYNPAIDLVIFSPNTQNY